MLRPGAGYARRLSGAGETLTACLGAVRDVYDVVISPRSHEREQTHEML